MSAIVRVNEIDPPYTIRPGQELLIPAERRSRTQTADAGDGPTAERDAAAGDGGRSAGTGAAAEASSEAGSDGGTTGRTQSKPAQRAGEPAQPADAERPAEPQATQASAPRPKEVPSPPPRSSGRFQWPVTGKILSGFGPQDGGLHNDGINIAAPRGTPIRAAENGVVAYVGNELKGFGNLLLIKHADNWITAYAHTEEILVDHGETVRRGQIVARVGSSGNVADPQLHFEIRKRSKAKDPQQLLGRQEARL
jgi:murein DD-endopeptidase MepM/ murein hydrolase activator NlpD